MRTPSKIKIKGEMEAIHACEHDPSTSIPFAEDLIMEALDNQDEDLLTFSRCEVTYDSTTTTMNKEEYSKQLKDTSAIVRSLSAIIRPPSLDLAKQVAGEMNAWGYEEKFRPTSELTDLADSDGNGPFSSVSPSVSIGEAARRRLNMAEGLPPVDCLVRSLPTWAADELWDLTANAILGTFGSKSVCPLPISPPLPDLMKPTTHTSSGIRMDQNLLLRRIIHEAPRSILDLVLQQCSTEMRQILQPSCKRLREAVDETSCVIGNPRREGRFLERMMRDAPNTVFDLIISLAQKGLTDKGMLRIACRRLRYAADVGATRLTFKGQTYDRESRRKYPTLSQPLLLPQLLHPGRWSLVSSISCLGTSLLSIVGISPLLIELDVNGSANLQDLTPLAACSRLKSLNISATGVSSLSLLSSCSALETLSLDNCRHINSSQLLQLSSCTSLKSLSFTNIAVANLLPLSSLTRLTEIRLSGTAISTLHPLASCQDLRRIYADNCPLLIDLSTLYQLTCLETLSLNASAQITSLRTLNSCLDLKSLSCQYLGGISDLSPLSSCPLLESLDLSGCTSIVSIQPLADLHFLKVLNCNQTRVADLSPLCGLQGLIQLSLSGTPINDIAPILHLSSLVSLSLSNLLLLGPPTSNFYIPRINDLLLASPSTAIQSLGSSVFPFVHQNLLNAPFLIDLIRDLSSKNNPDSNSTRKEMIYQITKMAASADGRRGIVYSGGVDTLINLLSSITVTANYSSIIKTLALIAEDEGGRNISQGVFDPSEANLFANLVRILESHSHSGSCVSSIGELIWVLSARGDKVKRDIASIPNALELLLSAAQSRPREKSRVTELAYAANLIGCLGCLAIDESVCDEIAALDGIIPALLSFISLPEQDLWMGTELRSRAAILLGLIGSIEESAVEISEMPRSFDILAKAIRDGVFYSKYGRWCQREQCAGVLESLVEFPEVRAKMKQSSVIQVLKEISKQKAATSAFKSSARNVMSKLKSDD